MSAATQPPIAAGGSDAAHQPVAEEVEMAQQQQQHDGGDEEAAAVDGADAGEEGGEEALVDEHAVESDAHTLAGEEAVTATVTASESSEQIPKRRKKKRSKKGSKKGKKGDKDDHKDKKKPFWKKCLPGGGHGHGPVGPDQGLLDLYHLPTSKIRNDFRTIDWFWSNFKLGRITREHMKRNAERRGIIGACLNAWLGVSTWIVLLAVGITVAINAVTISLTASWVSGLKGGICVGEGFWSTKDVCCAETSGSPDGCPNWKSWAILVKPDANSTEQFWLGYFFYVVIAVAMAQASYWVVHTFCIQAAGSGIPECTVILGGFVVKYYLTARALVIKTVALALSVGSGMNLGKEGPLVHIGCCWGSLATMLSAKYSRNEVKKREILSASAAAGVAAAFGAPLGGVLFSLESVSTYFPPKTMWRSFWCTISVVLFLKFMDPFGSGKLIEFEVDYTHEWKWFEIVPFCLVGCIGGVMGGLFIKFNMALNRYKRVTTWLRSDPGREIMLVALVTALFNYTIIYNRGSSTSLLADLFAVCDEYDPRYPPIDPAGEGIVEGLCSNKNIAENIMLLIIAGFAKWFLCVFTFTLKLPAGVFIPAMASGACLGRAVGWIVQLIQQSAGSGFPFAQCGDEVKCVEPSIYAVLGAAAMLGGITRMTICLAVVMFELTGGLQYILPLMVSLVWAKWSGDWTQKGGIYTHLIAFKGYPHVDSSLDLDEAAAPAEGMMSDDPVCITTYGQTISSIQTLLAARSFHGFPIVNNMVDKFVHGFITRVDLEAALKRALNEGATPNMHCHFSSEDPAESPMEHIDFSAEVDEFPVKVLPSTPADRLLHLFRGLGTAYCLVVNRKGVLVGILKKKDFCNWLQVIG